MSYLTFLLEQFNLILFHIFKALEGKIIWCVNFILILSICALKFEITFWNTLRRISHFLGFVLISRNNTNRMNVLVFTVLCSKKNGLTIRILALFHLVLPNAYSQEVCAGKAVVYPLKYFMSVKTRQLRGAVKEGKWRNRAAYMFNVGKFSSPGSGVSIKLAKYNSKYSGEYLFWISLASNLSSCQNDGLQVPCQLTVRE